MGKEKYYQYFVEGEDEKKLVDVLKSDMKLIVSGKSQVFNVTQQKLTRLRVMNLKPGTTVVLIFDADAGNLQILKDNINFLHKEKVVSEVICVIQVRNLEDELIRCCNIRQIKELLGSKSEKEYKTDLIKEKSLENFCGLQDSFLMWCPERDSNPHTQWITDFKSVASAISPSGRFFKLSMVLRQ